VAHDMGAAFMLYAQGILPFLVPLSVLLFEPDLRSRRRMLPFAALGLLTTLYILWALTAYPFQVYVRANSIVYTDPGTSNVVIHRIAAVPATTSANGADPRTCRGALLPRAVLAWSQTDPADDFEIPLDRRLAAVMGESPREGGPLSFAAVWDAGRGQISQVGRHASSWRHGAQPACAGMYTVLPSADPFVPIRTPKRQAL
jgi:hypothetical protein